MTCYADEYADIDVTGLITLLFLDKENACMILCMNMSIRLLEMLAGRNMKAL